MIRFVEHRIGDRRIIRLLQKWMKAGVLEDGVIQASERGTGQGSVISPLLANIYLHYAFDLLANRWRQREATGNMIIVRYADDTVVGFEQEADAHRFLDMMRTRLEEFALSLHPEKTASSPSGMASHERPCLAHRGYLPPGVSWFGCKGPFLRPGLTTPRRSRAGAVNDGRRPPRELARREASLTVTSTAPRWTRTVPEVEGQPCVTHLCCNRHWA